MRVYFILWLMLATTLLKAQPKDLKFRRITTDNGLSHSNIKSIIQDHKGFMWFGTADGLNKYDGHNITVYKHQIDDTTSLSSSDISILFEDSDNNLWVGTRYGLNLYDRKADNFIHHWETGQGIITTITEDRNNQVWLISGPHIYLYDKETKIFVQRDYTWLGFNIGKIYIDDRDTMWVAMPDANRIYHYNRQEQAYIPRYWDEELEIIVPEPVLSFNYVIDMKVDKAGILWFVSHGYGLYLYDRDNRTHSILKHEKNNRHSIWNDMVMCLEEDEDQNMWVGTQNGGISIYDHHTQMFYNYTQEPGDINSLSNNSITTIYRDHDNNMWIGTHSGGVNLAIEPKFSHYYSVFPNQNSLRSNIITSFCELDDSQVLVGTDGGGVNVFNLNTKNFSPLNIKPTQPNLYTNVVTHLIKGHQGNVWIGYWIGGLGLYNPKTHSFTQYSNSSDTNSLRNNNVMYLYEDKESDIWVATLTGLNLFDRKSNKFIYYNLGIGLENYVNSVLEDKDGNLWVGTWEGLKLLEKKSKNFESFIYSHLDTNTISNNKIFVIHEDALGKIWIGTAGGLNLLNKDKRTFTKYLSKDGLPSDAIYGILEDESGDLWLSTGDGISRFNPEMNDFKNYGISDGLQGREFKEHAFLKLSNGHMLFGGVNGFNMFNPNQIGQNTILPRVAFVDFRIFNKSVAIGTKDSPLQQHISETEKIILSYKESVFSIEFSALNYVSPDNVQYEYMLEGFDKGWINSGNQRNITYTNLDQGRYVFRVNATNHDGFWSMEGANLIIIITPPYYKTWWFRILATVMFIGLAIIWFKSRIRSIEMQRQKLAQQVEERTKELAIKSQSLMEANQEISLQGQRIQSLYNDMKDSIRAAKVIQQSFIESGKALKDHFKEQFIFNQPKDVVGGDFLWFDEIDGKKILAAVDCTGHGVSGAFMTIIGHQVLSQIVAQGNWNTAADILTQLNNSFTHKIKDSAEIQWNNGMDLAICIIENDNRHLQFAGAKNPLYIVRGDEMIQVKGDNSSIGVSSYNKLSAYTNHVIDVKKGDIVYLFSDGYVDQFGGPSGNQKLMYPGFRKLLLEISSEPLNKQYDLLKNKLRDWQSNAEQIDDILVVGVKI